MSRPPFPGTFSPSVTRITLTFPVLNAAYRVLFMVTGKAKAERVREVLSPASGKPAALPAARVQPANGMLTWLLDEAAGSLLGGR